MIGIAVLSIDAAHRRQLPTSPRAARSAPACELRHRSRSPGLAGLVAERSGTINIGLEGMMVMGTIFAGWWGWEFGPWMALARRHRRRHALRAADEPRHDHVRRQPHRRRRRHQPASLPASRDSWRASCSSTCRAARSPRRPATRVTSAPSPCRSCRAATCSAGRVPTSSAGSRTAGGSSSPTSPAW